MILARLRGSDPVSTKNLMGGLVEFGNDSGLFESFDIKSLGKSESSPFQMLFKIGGPAVNLIDMGYGVSQALPVSSGSNAPK